MANLISESYRNSTVNNIQDDIAEKYEIDTSKERLREDVRVQEIKFKYRTYAECLRILYKSVAPECLGKQIIQKTSVDRYSGP
jgi:hypothetical protein